MTTMLKNAWHMAGWGEEAASTTMLSRMIGGRRILILRRDDDTVSALDDRCPHRFAPLSRGARDGDVVTCGYHGLRFDSDGHCVGNPFSDRLPAGASVRTYPIVERDGILWIWPGDAERADAATIPDFSFLSDTPDEHLVRGYTRMAANYEYGTDNLMDLSHIEFVHKGSFAGAGVIFAGSHEVVQDGETLHSNWWMPDVAAPAHTQGIYPPEFRTDHWLEMRWNAPASMYLHIGATPVGETRATGVLVDQAHILTPETEDATHYFWVSKSPVPLPSEVAEGLRILFTKAFDEEDKPMIEAAYANVEGDFWNEKPVFIGIDAGGTRARRMLETLRRREALPLVEAAE